MRKENLPIIIGIALPLALITVIAAVVYIPASFQEPPTTDILFVNGNYEYGYGHYELRGSSVVLVPDPQPINDPYYRKPVSGPQLYRYDPETDVMQPISEADALKLKVNGARLSPEGFAVDQGGGGGGVFPFFFDDSNYGWYLRKGAYAEEVILPTTDIWSYQFLGWIVE